MEKDIINKIIRNRKSVYPKDYSKKEIPKKVIEEVLINANHAPTHRLTQPWFFKVYEKSSKENLCELISQIDSSKYSPTKIQKYIDKINQSDTVISVFMNRDKQNRLPEWEEMAAVSMAVQNMWLHCTELGIGGYWSSPSLINHLGGFFNFKEGERCLGFFYMGYYDENSTEGYREPIENKVDWLKN